MRIAGAALLAVCLGLGPASAFTSQDSDTINAGLDGLFTAYHEAGQFNGAVAVMNGGEVIFSAGYGEADHEAGIAVTPDTSFDLASLSKVFTSLVIMDLVEDGVLSLDEPVSTYLDHPRAGLLDQVTLVQLLAHTSGLKREVFENADDLARSHTRAEILDSLLGEPLMSDPGTAYAYSNAGYVLLRILAEEVTGQGFADLLQTRVFAPAGMTESGVVGGPDAGHVLAAGYDSLIGELVPADESPALNNLTGAGGLYSSARDMMRLTQALFADQILLPQTRAAMARPYPPGRGLGWSTLLPSGEDEAGAPLFAVGHNGDYSGINTSYLQFEPEGLALVMLSNHSRMDRNALFAGVVGILNGEAPPAPDTGPAPEDVVYRVAIDDSVEAALAETRRLAEANGTSPLPHPIRMLNVGNALLRQDRHADAIRIFELMVAAYPDSGWGYLALGGEALEAGNVEQARGLFERVLEIEPGNAFATEFLADIAARTE